MNNCVAQDVANGEYDCAAGRRWPSYTGTLALVVAHRAAVLLELKDAKSLLEGTMNGDEL